MTRLLITGGAGFIGSNLAVAALASDAVGAVRVLDDFSTGSLRNLDGVDVEIVEGSLLHPDVLDRALRNIDAVVHLAAIPSVPRSIANPVASHAANATGTLLLLEACRAHGVSYVTAASSSSVYGANPALPKHEREWVRPLSPYAVSKLATEQYLLAYQSSFGLDTLPFRFFNVYGPGQAAGHAYAAVIPAFVDAVLAGRPLTVNGTGTQSRDFTYVGTVCDILLDAVVRRVVSPEPVNLAFGSRTTLLELVGLVEEVTGRPATLKHGPVRAGDVPHSQADNAALRALFPGVVPTELRVGLERTVSWFCAGVAR
ncbi:NAD-dependent epimerase/dehydratase family protein [Blastococcus tunisiensis]|uniref:UDP-glucose 4-epimerase n=1 Tax=Blastococcus tunisiensis TaxID=1798228 RepID=A0A1I2K520_9ACTN|nr:NAD-dependent epimerase/dehydratase family protein [Blastococcus sp. DSM 46838]SFF61438.1 UDP-glucose 4-epimerase [Blastococcus sp. DSM 46838]